MKVNIMKTYEQIITVHAQPMKKDVYKKLRGWDLCDSDEDGYLMEPTSGKRLGALLIEEVLIYGIWLPKDEFERNYVEVPQTESSKTLHNSTVSHALKNVSDLQVYGNGDTFQLICKASSKAEGWMKSTKAMEIENVGCVIQVTTQQGDNIAEALNFVPGVEIHTKEDGTKFLCATNRSLTRAVPC